MTKDEKSKSVRWIGSSRSDLRKFPPEVRTDIGYALWLVQLGDRPPQAKPLKGIVSGSGVLEIVESHDGDAYRVVYTVRFAKALYVLHAFQKKSTRAKKTAQHDIDLIRSRLKMAQDHYQET